MCRIIFFSFCLSLFSIACSAQINRKGFYKNEKVAIFAGLNTAVYYGDVCDKPLCMRPSLGFGIGITYRFTSFLGNKTSLSYYHLQSTDIYPIRNLGFKSDNLELYTAFTADLFPYTKYYKKRRLLSPFVFVGIGITTVNPKAKDPATGHYIALRPLRTEGVAYSPLALIVPIGAGVRIKINKLTDVVVQAGVRKAFTDRLDDVSAAHYQNLDSFSDPVAARLSMRSPTDAHDPISYSGSYLSQKRGSPKYKDLYMVLEVQLRHVVGGKNKRRRR